MFRRPPSLHLPVVLATLLVLAAGCGNDLTDGDFGGVDLLPFFFDSEAEDPEPPASYKKRNGYLDGVEVQYFDFGWSAALKDRPDETRRNQLGLAPGEKIPKVAPINPMYFFFDSKGNPMFAPPIRETKTGSFVLPGGSDVRNPNPSENAIKTVAYAVRKRDLLRDQGRGGSADYQRPIVDVIFDRDEDEVLQDYSGLWEFVRVRAPDGYKPDTIKSFATLEKGVASGDFKVEESAITATTELLAINCPLLDSRSLVIPNLSAYSPDEPRIPQPRVELWYRRKRIDCFLVNGWETLGKTIPGPNGDDKYVLYKNTAAENASRIGVLDTDVAILGEEGAAQKRRLVAPLGQLYIPRIAARDESFFVDNAYVTTGNFPRRTKSDPTGYRPVRWWWNIAVTDVGGGFFRGSLEEAGLTDIRNADDSIISPRESITLNFPLTSKVIPCSATEDPCPKLGLVCGVTAGTGLEYCHEPAVRYGETCAPTLAQCRTSPDDGKAPGSSGPDLIENWFVDAVSDDKTLAALAAANVPPEWIKTQADLKMQGTRRIVQRRGGVYSCLQNPVTEVGTCYLSCNGATANYLQGQKVKESLKLDDGRTVEVDYPLDSRCGGGLLPGFRCLPVLNAPTDGGGNWCLRDCNAGAGLEYNNALCKRPTPAYLSDKLINFDIAKNTSCQSINLVDSPDDEDVNTTFGACIHNQAFTPFAE